MSPEVVIDERPSCPRCGGPMDVGQAFLCIGGGRAARMDLPPTCADPDCRERDQAQRDAAALDRAIASGLIDP